MTDTLTDGQQGGQLPVVPPLLARVLRPYKPHCRYLQAATITFKPGQPGSRHPSCVGRFEIPESCYIDDTGHFNSVEFNICYNQLFYYAIARLVADGSMLVFQGWTLDDFWSLQLQDILIVDFRSTFRRAMRGQAFAGELEIVEVTERKGGGGMPSLILLDTLCRYWDAGGGYCHGEIKMAITNPPEIV